MTRDEAAWHEAMRQGEAAWHVGRDYPGAPMKCYCIDPKYLRIRDYGEPLIKVEWRKETSCFYIWNAPIKMRIHAALRRFWRAFKG